MARERTTLTRFEWYEATRPDDRRSATVPTNIHLDLLAAALIPDPFIGKNEADVQWVHSKDWVYTCSFAARKCREGEHVKLAFEGLDTFATVTLNGQEILRSDNMFVPLEVEVDHILQADNTLSILFDSAYNRSESLRKEHGSRICWNGHYGRVYVRKAQYHFGWDWGPSLVTCGPWKPVHLDYYYCRIQNIRVDVDLDKDLEKAHVRCVATAEGDTIGCKVETIWTDTSGKSIGMNEEKHSLSSELEIHSPELWYPFTHGRQPLYRVQVTVKSPSGEVLDKKSQTFGVRLVELVQSPLEEGNTFYFAINNLPIFMGGSNWIPGDSFLPRMTPERYRRWIDLVVRGNQNMVRIWGGGIYESDAFYEECDRRGVLVWQDFCFACGQYPSDQGFINSVKQEAEAVLVRLRNHPSLVILAGNNEDYQVANEALSHDMTLPESEWLKTSFGARLTYERILPDLVKEHSSGIVYWPGSPFGGEDNNTDRTAGDVHIWNVSSGILFPYQRYAEIAGRFVSEFGMISCPNLETVKATYFEEGDFDLHPQSASFEFHCKASSYEKRMFTCMGENFRLSFDLSTYVYLTQLLQSEAMGYAYRGWRRKFEGRQCGGALVWQTNDVWPATSWALVDYYERPKSAYYVISRALAPLAIGISRNMKVNPRPNAQHEAFAKSKTKAATAGVIAHATPHIYPPRESTYAVWVASSASGTTQMKSRLRFISIETGQEVRPAETKLVDAKPHGTTEVLSGQTPESEPTVLEATLLDTHGNVVAREMDWPQPLKHLTFPDRHVKIKREAEAVTVSVDKPVKGLFLLNEGVEWSDNCLDLAPGSSQTVKAKGLIEDVRFIYYGM